jgi:anaphase-promoting complex subunit 11
MPARKRPSDTVVVEASTTTTTRITPSGTTIATPQEKRGSRIRVTFKKYHAVARWSWGTAQDDVCGICQMPFEGCAPGVKYPGDECPVVWGKCKHAFHLQCVSTWLGSGKSTCPICRAEWEFESTEKKAATAAVDGPPAAVTAAAVAVDAPPPPIT